MRNKITLALVALLTTATFALTGCSSEQATASAPNVSAAEAQTIGVSALKANPDKYLGTINVTGKAAKIYASDGVVELSDDKACCAIYLLVPSTDAQKAKLGVNDLYKGNLPAVGQPIAAMGILEKTDDGYFFKVQNITVDKKVVVEKI